MSESRTVARGAKVLVTDSDGLRAFVDTPAPSADGSRSGDALVRLDGGRQVMVPFEVLSLQSDGSYTLPFSLSESLTQTNASGEADAVEQRQEEDSVVAAAPQARADERVVVPVIAETFDVRKRRVETGGVRIRKLVHEREEIVDQPLMREEVHVKRVPINRVVDEPIPVRHVGNTMIVSLLEEVLVVEKRLMLKEELHITKGEVETFKPQRITLRSEEALIERFGEEPDPAAGNGTTTHAHSATEVKGL